MAGATKKQAPGSHRSGASVAVTALGCAVALAACGSSGKSATTKSSSPAAAGLAFSACMRAHGLSNFPDPLPSGGIQFSDSAFNPSSPAFKIAQSACHKLLPRLGAGAGRPSAELEAQMVKASRCMRAHGITGFPDPTTTVPSDPSAYSAIEDRGGVVLSIPHTINVQSPAYRQAAAACNSG